MLNPISLGIIAGNRSLPLIFAAQARRFGIKKLVAIAFRGETDPNLEKVVDRIVWLRVGQLSKMIKALKNNEVKQCVMVGQIAPGNLFDLRPDLRAMKILLRLKQKNAHSIFGAIAEEMQRDGVQLIEATPWLEPLMPKTGYQIGPKLSLRMKSDVNYGFRIAKEISRLDIGQTVVVKNGTVLAVEGFEGTDKCLVRGGELAGRKGGAVAIKVAKNNHDLRFDIPCVGSATVKVCAEAKIAALAFEAGKTLILDQPQVERDAIKLAVSLSSVE